MCAHVDVGEVVLALIVDVVDSKLESVLESKIAFTGVSHLDRFGLSRLSLGL